MALIHSSFILFRHLNQIGAGGLEFCFQMLLLLFRRELSWEESNKLWDAIFAQHVFLKAEPNFHCPGCFLDTGGNIETGREGAHPETKHIQDVFRSLSIAAAVALLISHRKSLLRCTRLEELVQLANRLPDQGMGSGLRIATMASKLVTSSETRKRSPITTFTCGCIDPG